jgi:hypothetical protein
MLETHVDKEEMVTEKRGIYVVWKCDAMGLPYEDPIAICDGLDSVRKIRDQIDKHGNFFVAVYAVNKIHKWSESQQYVLLRNDV